MKRAMVISIFCVVFLSACGNVSESTESESSSVASQTTVTAIVSAETSTKEEMDTSETTTTIKKSSQTVSETSKAKTTKKSTVSSKDVSLRPPQEQTKQQSYSQTAKPQENTEVDTTQIPAVTTTQQKQTATAPPKPVTTTQKPQTTTPPTTKPPESTVTWSDTMKAWRKLCEGQSLSGDEQNLIRSEILEYAKNFNGKRDIHVSFGIDEYDISYANPINMTVREDMTDLSYAHMDAYADSDSKWLIDHAENEEEICSIVSETRENCLHVIDYGLFNRWEIYSGNNALKYASDIEFNVGFDGTAIWFLTED